MFSDSQTQAVLLLTSWFSKPGKDDPRPLTPTEWGRFAQWLKERDIQPGVLLEPGIEPILADWQDPKMTVERLRALLGRAVALGLATERWERAGLWVLTRADADYPSRLKQLLKQSSPPLLFGCGNRRLLDQGGIAVVGSRDASADDLMFTRRFAAAIARGGESVISGGARGVDETAMLAALEQEGTVVGVLSDNLLSATASTKYRPHLVDDNLVLISPFYPEAGFDVGNAMARNKYVYCLSDAAVVVAAGRESGGTRSGALENLKHNRVPLWIRLDPDPESGNADLIRLGAHPLPTGDFAITDLKTMMATGTVISAPILSEQPADKVSPPADLPYKEAALPETFYAYFLARFAAATHDQALSLAELDQSFDVSKAQLSAWLKQAEADGVVVKIKGRTPRYRFDMHTARQVPLPVTEDVDSQGA